MGDVFKRLLQTIRFERDAVVWMDFNDRATGDALILVALTRFLLFLGLVGFGNFRALVDLSVLSLLVQFMIQGAIFWLAFSGLAYVIQRFLFQRGGNFPVILRLSGFAYPTVLASVAAVQIVSPTSRLGFTIASVIGALWFMAIVARAMNYIADLDLAKGAITAAGAWAGYLVVTAILSGLPI